MRPEDWIALAGILATAMVSIGTLIFNWSRTNEQQKRDDKLRMEQLEREDKIRKEQRAFSPHIEFEVQCNLFGPEDDAVIAELLLVVRNKGAIQQQFNDIRLRIRGIEDQEGLSFWQGHEPRLAFPIKLVDNTSIKPNNYNFLFVEPGITQVVSYVTKIPISIKYISVHAEFRYDQFTPHTTERVFAVGLGDRQRPPE